MKRALRIIIPLLLVVVLLTVATWYLLVYDQEFTRDMLLTQARQLEEAGNHKAAAWMYNLCYQQSSMDDNVAIELARQYVKAGNYTKAEYTISKAISQKPSAPLYAALCSIYIEQDKLLDAVNLLDTISDPDIKAKLDASRPPVPTVSLNPGFYSQYITVNLECPGSKLYVSTDGHYPSTEDGFYEDPITLPGGETVIYAVAVDGENLVSPLGVFAYTVGGVIEEVTFADPAIDSSVRSILGVSETKTLYTDHLWTITSFTVPAEATSFEDLKYFTYLRSLTVENSNVDLSVVSKLTSLEELTLRNCKVSDEVLQSIGNLKSLRHLTMESCSLTTIEPLSGLTGLVSLDLSNNTLRNISVISGMTRLQKLDLSQNAVVDLTALSGLSVLNTLDVSSNALSTLSPIFTNTELLTLCASNNQITSIAGISTLKSLGILDLSQNQLTDVSDLGDCNMLVELNISNNTITDISELYDLISLRTLNLAHNLVKTLPEFVPEAALVIIDASYNQLTTIKQLAGLPQLINVHLDYNEQLASLEPLDSCPLLIQVDAYGTKVKRVSFLTEKSVIVNYDSSR